MSDFSDSHKTTITFKPWPRVKDEVVAAIREIAPEPLAQNVFPSTIHIEGYPGPGITTSVFKATWRTEEQLIYRVRVYLDKDSTNRAEVI